MTPQTNIDFFIFLSGIVFLVTAVSALVIVTGGLLIAAGIKLFRWLSRV
jgi:hypothetical protein